MTQNDLDLINQPDPSTTEIHRLSRVVKRARERGIKPGDGFAATCHSAEPEPQERLGPTGECQAQGDGR